MKKIILSILLIVVINTINYSQIVLRDSDGNNISGQTFVPSTNFLAPNIFKVENTGSSEITVNVEVTELILAPNYGITFCWVVCPTDGITRTGVISEITCTIPPNSIATELADIYVTEDGGTERTFVSLKFFEVSNPSNYANITFDSDYVASINEANSSNNLVAYPNPANTNVTFSYNIKNSENAFITIYNILGKEVKQSKIETKNDKISINISDLNSGVYFYNLTIDNKIFNTKKLIINNWGVRKREDRCLKKASGVLDLKLFLLIKLK